MSNKPADNVYAAQNNKTSDFASILRPELNIEKEWGRHKTAFDVILETRRFWNETSENTTDFEARLETDLEAYRRLHIPLHLEYKTNHVSRENQRQAFQADLTKEPLKTRAAIVGAGVVYKPNRLSLSLLGEYEERRFEDGTLVSGAWAVRKDRDYDALQARFRGSYETQARWHPFTETTLRKENYKRGLYTGGGFNGVTRDNMLVRFLAGVSFDYKGLVFGEIAAGYEDRNYDSPSVSGASGTSAAAKITWAPAQKMRLVLDFSKQTAEDNIVIAALDKTEAALQLDYEVTHDVFARLSGGYRHEDFVSTGRTDETFNTGLDLRYILSPHVRLGAGYSYNNRDSDAPGASFENNVFMVTATGAL